MTRQSFNVGITIFKRLVRSMEKDFYHKYQLWKLFDRIRNQTAAYAQKGVKCPLRNEQVWGLFFTDLMTSSSSSSSRRGHCVVFLGKTLYLVVPFSIQEYQWALENFYTRCNLRWTSEGLPGIFGEQREKHDSCFRKQGNKLVKR